MVLCKNMTYHELVQGTKDVCREAGEAGYSLSIGLDWRESNLDINEIIQDGDIIGVGWGTTLHSLSHQLIPTLEGAQIVQLEGGITLSTSETYANEILEKFAKNYETIAQYLPLPVLFDSKEVKEMVYRDRHIKRVLELGRNANIAIFSSVLSATTPYSSAWAMPIPKKKPTSRATPSATSAPASSTKTATSPARN